MRIPIREFKDKIIEEYNLRELMHDKGYVYM